MSGPSPASVACCPRTFTVVAADLTDTNAIKASVASAITAQSYTGSALDGGFLDSGKYIKLTEAGNASRGLPRLLTATLSAQAGAYVSGSKITIVGTDENGREQTEQLTITTTDGPLTLTTTKAFIGITSIAVEAQASALGAFIFGIVDVVFNRDAPARYVRGGAAGTIKIGYGDGSFDLVPTLEGEHHPVMFTRIYASGTTFPITIGR